MLLSGCLSTGGDTRSSVAAPDATVPEVADDQQVQITFGDLAFAIDALGVKALDDLVGAEAVDAHFNAGYPFHERARTLADRDGKTYGIPYVFSTPTLLYNADLFRAAGLDPDDPPATWAEVKQAALAIREHTGQHGVYVACSGPTAGDWCMQGIVRSNGGRVLSEDRGTLTFAEPEAVEAIAMWQDLVASGAHPDLSINGATETFGRGELGMYLQSSALQGALLQAAEAGGWELRAGMMPGFGDEPAVPTNSGSALFVLSGDPARQRAAWELIKFFTSEHAYTEITSNIGYLPLRTGLLDDPDGLQAWAKQHQALIEPNLAQLDRLEPWVSFPGDEYMQIRNLMTAAVEEVVFRGADPQATLAEAQRRATELMPQE